MRNLSLSMLCYVNQVHFTLKIKTGASTRFLRVNHTTAGFPCLRGVGCLWTEQGTVGEGRWWWWWGWVGCLHLLPAEEETGQREERWDKGEVKEGEARMVHIRWQGNLQQEMTCPRNCSFLLVGDGRVGGFLAALSARLTPPPVRSDCGTDVNRQAQTSAGC